MAQDEQNTSSKKQIGFTLTVDEFRRLKSAAAAAGVPTNVDAVLVRWAVNRAILEFQGIAGSGCVAPVMAGEAVGGGNGLPSSDRSPGE